MAIQWNTSSRDLEKVERESWSTTDTSMQYHFEEPTDFETPPQSSWSSRPNSRTNILPRSILPQKKSSMSNEIPQVSILVDWNGANDPGNPLNWSTSYKSWITFLMGMLALSASLGSSIISPAANIIAAYIGVEREVSVLSVSLYM